MYDVLVRFNIGYILNIFFLGFGHWITKVGQSKEKTTNVECSVRLNDLLVLILRIRQTTRPTWKSRREYKI